MATTAEILAKARGKINSFNAGPIGRAELLSVIETIITEVNTGDIDLSSYLQESDIYNGLDGTGMATRPLAAAQGPAILAAINALAAEGGGPAVIDDDTTGGSANAWSAERGKVIRTDLAALQTAVNAVAAAQVAEGAGKVLQFDTRDIAIGASIGAAERVICYGIGAVDTILVYDVSTGSTPGADDAADLANGQIQFAGGKMGTLVSPWFGSFFPEQFGARQTSSDTAAFNACRAFMFTKTLGGRMVLGPYAYVLDGTFFFETSAGFYGVQVEGSGIDKTVLRCKPAASSSVMLHARGGSGNSTSKAISNLTIEPFDVSYENLGIGLAIENLCFFKTSNVKFGKLGCGTEIANTTNSLSFSEHNHFHDCRWVQTKRPIQFHRRSTGANSFHGQRFYNCQVDLPINSDGIMFNGTSWAGTASSGQIYLYNCFFDIKIISTLSSGQVTTAINYNNINMETCKGLIQMEKIGAGTIQFLGTSGPFILDGEFMSISAMDFPTANLYRFGRMVVQKAPFSNFATMAHADMTDFRPHPLRSLEMLDKVNTISPALMGLIGTNREAAAFVFYNGDQSNGLYITNEGFGTTDPSLADPRLFLRHDGALIESWATSLNLRTRGNGNQLVIANNGRVGGALGRLPPVTSVSANVGVVQTINLWTNNDRASGSEFHLRIFSTAGSTFDYDVWGKFSSGNGAVGRVILEDPWVVDDDTNGAVYVHGFQVSNAGVLQLLIETDRALTIDGCEVSLKTVLTS